MATHEHVGRIDAASQPRTRRNPDDVLSDRDVVELFVTGRRPGRMRLAVRAVFARFRA